MLKLGVLWSLIKFKGKPHYLEKLVKINVPVEDDGVVVGGALGVPRDLPLTPFGLRFRV